MKKNLTLFQKGLLFIAAPILVQLVLIFSLLSMLDQLELLEQAEYHSKNVIGHTNWYSYVVSCALASSLGYVITGDKDSADLYATAKKQIAEEGPAFSKELDDNPEQKQRVEGGVAVVQQLVEMMDKWNQTPGATKELIASKAKVYECTDLLMDLRHDLLRIDREGYKLELIPSQRRILKSSIIALGLLSVFSGGLLFYVYNRGVTNRLAILAENTDKFSKREPLHQLLPGHDEVAQLDSSFHDMAN